VSFNHTFKYIDDILSINSNNFAIFFFNLIYPDELEIKETKYSDKSTSYLYILLNIDSNGRLTTTLYGNVLNLTLQSSTFLFYVVRYVSCKTNTLPILMHQMRISTTQVSSVMLRSKKLEIRK
jgi:hypothetical protein